MISLEKKHIIKDSIRRLLELSISDREILDNLKSVGIEEGLSKELLQETKDELSGKKKPEEKPVEGKKEAAVKPFEKKRVLPAEEITEDLFGSAFGEEEELKTPVIRKPINNPQYESSGQVTMQVPPTETSSENLTELWEKGILSTVNARLTEMKKIKDELDGVLDKKIGERVKLESKKIETVLDSQRTLFYSKIDAHLEAKSDEVKKVLEAKARQLEEEHSKVMQQLTQVQAEKKFDAELLNTLNQKLAVIDTLRSQLATQTNSSLASMETKFSQFMVESARKRDDLESRIKNTLQLESNITDGMVESARQQIEALKLKKEEELAAQVNSRVKVLDEAMKKIDHKGISQKVSELTALEQQLSKKERDIDIRFDRKATDLEKQLGQRFDEVRKEILAFKKDVAKVQTENLEELGKEYGVNVDELFAEHLVAWNKVIFEKKKELEELKKQVDIEKYNATLDALDEFKQQFLNTVKKSIQDYNKTKRELAESIIERDKAINDYLKKIDAKIQELSDFQKSFSKDVAQLLDSIPAKKEKARKK